MGSSKQQKIRKIKKTIIKTHPQSRPAKRPCLERIKPLDLMTVAHFSLFFQSPRVPKMTSKWDPKVSLRAPKHIKIRKNEHSKNMKKTALQKVSYGCDLASKMVDHSASKTLPKY